MSDIELDLYKGLEAERQLIISPDSGERVKELAWDRVDNILDMISDLRIVERTTQVVTVLEI